MTGRRYYTALGCSQACNRDTLHLRTGRPAAVVMSARVRYKGARVYGLATCTLHSAHCPGISRHGPASSQGRVYRTHWVPSPVLVPRRPAPDLASTPSPLPSATARHGGGHDCPSVRAARAQTGACSTCNCTCTRLHRRHALITAAAWSRRWSSLTEPAS